MITNDFYHPSGNPFFYNGKPYASLAAWIVATGGDTHSSAANPLLHGSTDFRLNIGSPAIGAGVNLGSSYEMALNPDVSTWFPGIVNQNSYGTGWAIGAYVFNPQPLPPSNLRSVVVGF